jgi:hypothetical protein
MRALAHREAGDRVGAREAAAEATAIGERHAFPFWIVVGNLATALDLDRVTDPDAEDRVAALISVWRFAGVEVWTPAFLVEQGKVQLARGNAAGALVTLQESAELATRSGTMLYAAESMRLIGEARLALGDDAGSADLARAVEIASGQGARLFELRARTALRRHDPTQEDGTALAAVLTDVEAGGPLDSPLAPTADLDAAREALAT